MLMDLINEDRVAAAVVAPGTGGPAEEETSCQWLATASAMANFEVTAEGIADREYRSFHGPRIYIDYVRIERGLAEGSVLSPRLYTILLADLLVKLKDKFPQLTCKGKTETNG